MREAGSGDVAAIARLLGQLGYPAGTEAVGGRLRAHLASPDDVLLVAQRGDEIVGLAALHVSIALEYDGLAGKLSAIVVDERARSQGVGRQLVAAVEAEARRRGCVLLFLTTAERRAGAHAFYRSVGFEETGRRFAKTLD